MAVMTLKGHVSRAKAFYDTVDIYFCMGRTTPWDDESTPPVPLNTDDMEEPAGYKLVDSKFMVAPVESPDDGEIRYRGNYWKIVPYDEAVDQGARWVYISANIAYNDFPTDLVYRQLGIYTGLKKAAGIESAKGNLLPKEVEDPGVLEVLDNRTPVYRDLDQREIISTIIEF